MMFQARTHAFQLRNAGAAKLPFAFAVESRAEPGSRAPGPFALKPAEGVIAAGETVTVTVRFAPDEVVDCDRVIRCAFPGTALDDGFAPLEIPLGGKVNRPWCHFELPESEYLAGGRRPPGAGAVDGATRVVECVSLGLGVRNTRRFMVLNPTNVAYEFEWRATPVDGTPPEAAFTCATPRGVVAPGKRYEMVFEYVPTSDQPAEAAFEFRIDRHGISTPFLFAGCVTEPRVSFDAASVNFGKVLVGAKHRRVVTLSNHEHIPFQFAFDKSTFENPGGTTHAVSFEPSSGTVPPLGDVPITVVFVADAEKPRNFNVVAEVRRKPSPLSLNVKGEGYALHETLELESMVPGEEKPARLLAAPSKNAVDLGQVLVNETRARRVSFVNDGDVGFDFAWDFGRNPRVVVTPEFGTVGKGERFACQLSYSPEGSESLSNYKVTCDVVGGRKYDMRLDAVGYRPALKFSWHQFDFGPSHVHQSGMPPKKHQLVIRNDDDKPFAIDCLFDPSSAPFLAVGETPTSLEPGKSASVEVEFFPRVVGKARASIPFQINGLYTVHVNVSGEGVPLRVELANPEDASVNFGSLREGQSCSREIKIANRGKLPAEVRLTEACVEALRDVSVVAAAATAKRPLVVPPHKTGTIRLVFAPKRRSRPFQIPLEVSLAGGAESTLSLLQGSCVGVEVKLARDNVDFGAVTLGSRVTRPVLLQNTGDVGATFAFDARAFGPNFSLFPTEGFAPPNRDVTLEATFHPTEITNDARVDRAKCRVDGAGELELTLGGRCVEQKAEEDAVEFRAGARTSDAKEVSVSNPTDATWHVKPTVTGEHWSGAEFLEIPAGGSASYAITYRPLSMATEEAPHEGSVSFPLPDGAVLLHALRGVADPPESSGTVEAELPAKKLGSVAIGVANWLPRRQRFRATVGFDGEPDPSVTIKGPDFVDLPAAAEREYKLGVYAHKEGPVAVKVTFTNEETNEYMHYDVVVAVTAPDVIDTLSLRSACRQRAKTTVYVDNPLDAPVALTCACDVAHVHVPETVEIPAKSRAPVDVAYRPVVVESIQDATLTLSCEELGEYPYALRLSSTPAGPERGLAFSVPLGSRETKAMKFTHYLDDKADYACAFQTNTGEFECAAAHTAHPAGPEGMEQELEVTFEPTRVGAQFRDVLVVTSETGGEYLCPVMGRCVPPKPKGPFVVRGGSGSVEFKNVFAAETEFTLTTDNPAFVVSRTEKIGAKQTKAFSVAYKAPEEGVANVNAKLMVTCAGVTTPWVYYLKATP